MVSKDLKNQSCLIKKEFCNSLKDKYICDEDYEHVMKVWNELKLENMGDYHDLYLKNDVLLLGKVFEEIKNMCLEYYE